MVTRRHVLCSASAAVLGMGQAQRTDRGDLAGLLEPIRLAHNVPALSAAVIVNGAVVATAAVGVRKHGDPTPATVDDRFHLGSCTKAMTAVLIATLIEGRKLDWDTPLSKLLPDLGARLHRDLRSVTVDHLLAHRSGLSPKLHPRPASLAVLVEARQSPAVSRRERWAYVATILSNKPETLPGQAYAYCNAGYIVLGAIVERLFEESWEDLMRRRVFDRLRMASGGFGAMGTPGKVDQPWQHRVRDGNHVPVAPGPLSDNPPELGPAGTAHCAVGDWAKFLIAQMLGETRPGHLLKPATWRRLHTPQFGGEYAGGWIVTQRDWGGRVLTHAGSNTMSYCVAWLAPAKRFGVGAMTNQGDDAAAKACDQVAARAIAQFLPLA